MKMADLIHMDYHLTMVINRFGIKLGFGDSSIGEICEKHDIDPDFFLEIVTAYHDKNYFPDDKLKNFPISLIVNYLKSTHQFYVDEELPKIERLINNVISTNKGQEKHFVLMKNFFLEYQLELVNHIKREEVTVYPYAKHVEECFVNKTISEKLRSEFAAYSMETYEREHDDVEEKLLDLKNIIIKYLPPPADNRFYNQILFNLFRLEADLNEHSRIENTVLIPSIRRMEQELQTLIEAE